MSIQLPVKILVLISFLTMIAGSPACAQQEIEKYLLEQNLVSELQLKAYKNKEKADDEYLRLMIKLMKRKIGDRKYKREMEKEYKEEIKKKAQNKDTLALLADILEVTRKQRSYVTAQIDTSTIPSTFYYKRNDSMQMVILAAYARQLRSKGMINEESVKNLSKYILNGNIDDSCDVVRNAIGFRDKSNSTAGPKLAELMILLKDLKLLSEDKYKKLRAELFPDSINKIFHIVSNCEKVLFSENGNYMIRGEEEFHKLIASLSRLTGIEVSNPVLRLIKLPATQYYRYRSITVLELESGGKNFSHEENEMMSTEEKLDLYPLYSPAFYKLFNKILSYKNSPYRIHAISEKMPDSYVHIAWSGYIMLTKEQDERLYHNENINITLEENMSPLTETAVLKAIDLYKGSGLFNKVTQGNIDSVLRDIRIIPVFRYNELISRFSAITIENDDRFRASPEEMIIQVKKMAQLSDHWFDPKNIRIEKDSTGKRQILFEFNNKTYRNDVDEPWLTSWRLIHHATFTELKQIPFEVLRISQHKEIYIYLPSEKMKMLKKEKVIGDW